MQNIDKCVRREQESTVLRGSALQRYFLQISVVLLGNPARQASSAPSPARSSPVGREATKCPMCRRPALARKQEKAPFGLGPTGVDGDGPTSRRFGRETLGEGRFGKSAWVFR